MAAGSLKDGAPARRHSTAPTGGVREAPVGPMPYRGKGSLPFFWIVSGRGNYRPPDLQ